MDTENKRRSVVGLYGVRTVPPVPGTDASASKRRHEASLYAISSQAGRTSFWVQVQLTTPQTWKQDGDSSQPWVPNEEHSTDWTPVLETDE